MKAVYCIITDYNYLSRALCLYRSLEPFMGDSGINLYCVDAQSYDVVVRLNLDWAAIINHELFGKPEIRRSRPHIEYCWTLKPVVLRDAMKRWEADYYIHLDADTMAFDDPVSVIPVGANTLLTPHRFSPEFTKYTDVGRHNAGFVAFREEGHQALAWWEERCLEFCPSTPTRGIYADQTYLDELQLKFPFVLSSEDRRLNAAPWNIAEWNDEPIILYHFQGLRMFSLDRFDLYCGDYKLPDRVVQEIYWPYIRRLIDATLEIKSVDHDYPCRQRCSWYQRFNRSNPLNL